MERRAFGDEFPGAQLGMTVLVTVISMVTFTLLAVLLAIPIFGPSPGNLFNFTNLSDPNNIPILKYIQIVQSTSLFIIPPIFLGKIFLGNTSTYLNIDKLPVRSHVFIVVALMIVCIPIVNLIAELNTLIRFPEFMSSVQNYLENAEKDAQELTEAFLKVTTLSGLAINLLMIGIIPAIGEEFLFRGVLQRIFSNLTRNHHWGIIISAGIFSAIHMQFYGFFPRFLLGALFGYLYVWSGSLWLPILAHFINNSLAVVTYYLVSTKILDEKIINVGSTNEILPLAFLSFLLAGYAIYRLYLVRKKAGLEIRPDNL